MSHALTKEAQSIVATPEPRRRQYRSAGRDEQKRETRARILDCAIVHFSERGFEAGSLRDIAAEAGVTHAVIRLHFGGKEELWRAAIDLMFERQNVELDYAEVLSLEKLTEQSLRDLIHRYVRYCARHPEHVRIMIHESMRDSDRLEWVVGAHIKRTVHPLTRLLARAIEEKIVIDVPMHSLMYILTSASQMIFALGAEGKHLYDLDMGAPDIVEGHAEALCAMLIRA
ncbi:TetR family transcriptional regulator [Sphingomonas sp. PP-F2F-A104-K0414]|uniref:TetR/AcrR family transcriptional regulator n=1 Tax=Sphingomonas sp. PP-F2F-A104-K0414 TaxID=2135661 RepID=UPI00104595B1|nr:TetR family transcriptional regulator [Sphingomonas sp. PP-F2F-A104-K0414]